MCARREPVQVAQTVGPAHCPPFPAGPARASGGREAARPMTVPRNGGPRSGPYSAKRTLAGSATFWGDGRGWRSGPAPGCGAAEERKTRGFAHLERVAPSESRVVAATATDPRRAWLRLLRPLVVVLLAPQGQHSPALAWLAACFPGPGSVFWWHGVPHGTQLAPTRPPTVSTAGPGGLSACGWLSALLNLCPGSWLCLARATPAKARVASFCSKSGPGPLLGSPTRLTVSRLLVSAKLELSGQRWRAVL